MTTKQVVNEMQHISYFKGFNALRFLAAFTVLIGHVEQARAKFNLYSFSGLPFAHRGSMAVIFFFVLSGFLISYLLFSEEKKTNTISIRSFYWRRVYRIWPLYFVLVFLGLFAIPFATKLIGISYDALPFWPSIAFFVLMLPNLVTTLFGSNFLTPLWSIGVEEQFYLFWAPMTKYLKKYFLTILCLIIVLRLVFYHFEYLWMAQGNWLYFKEFLLTQKFECMAVGAFGAYLVFYHFTSQLQKIVFHKLTQLLCISILILGIFTSYTSIQVPIIGPILPAIVFLILIINVGINPKVIFHLNQTWLNKLGEWSYGIYMYHSIVAFAVLSLFANYFIGLNPVANTFLIYTSVCSLTILISWLSYRFIELPIIKLKHRLP